MLSQRGVSQWAALKRVYETLDASDGTRFLVERLWLRVVVSRRSARMWIQG